MRGEEDPLRAEIISLSRLHGPLVYRIARRYAHTPTDIEDLTQDIWVRVIDVFPRKNPASPVEGWLCVVAANVGLEHLKRRKRVAKLKQLVPFFDPGPEVRHPIDDTVAESTGTRIWQAIDALPPLQRQVFLHRVFEGLSTEETARAIHRAEGTVKASLHRALKSLGSELADLEALWSSGDL